MTAAHFVVSLPDDRLFDAMGAPSADLAFIRWDLAGPPPLDVIDLVVTPYFEQIKYMSALSLVRTQLVQSQLLGYDGIADVLPGGIVYANAASVHETSTAELAVALTLASQRGLDDFVRAAQRSTWAPAWHASLADRTVLLVGYGGVGKAIEARLVPFEVSIIRVARRARLEPQGPVHSIDELPGLLGLADVVIVAVPLADETTDLIDDAFLSAMRDGALLVNVARGKVASTAALVDHARRGRLRLALDVTDPEPLPAGHPLFSYKNVIISPHVGGATSAMTPRMARLVHEQIDRLRRSDAPVNVVLRT